MLVKFLSLHHFELYRKLCISVVDQQPDQYMTYCITLSVPQLKMGGLFVISQQVGLKKKCLKLLSDLRVNK